MKNQNPLKKNIMRNFGNHDKENGNTNETAGLARTNLHVIGQHMAYMQLK